MPTYLVEVYAARSQPRKVRASGRRARTAAEAVSREGTPVTYLRTTFLPDDETCFHFFDAICAAAVEEVSRRAELDGARVVAVEERAASPRGA